MYRKIFIDHSTNSVYLCYINYAHIYTYLQICVNRVSNNLSENEDWSDICSTLPNDMMCYKTTAEPSNTVLRPSGSSTAQAILAGGYAIAEFLKGVLNVRFKKDQHEEVPSLRHRVPYGDPTGVLAVHLKACRKLTSSAPLKRQTLCCLRVSVGAIVKYTILHPYKEHLSSSSKFSLFFNERKYFSIQIPMHNAEALAMWESELLNVELICIDPNTDIPKVFGKGNMKLLEILDKPPFTHQFNLKVNNQVTCKLEADIIFTYGSFGYGHSHQIKHPNRTMQDQVEKSIFLRIPPSEDRRDSHYNVITPSTLPTVHIVNSLIQQDSQMGSECRMSAVVIEYIKKRGRFLQMYEALEKCETGKEMVEFLERIILKKSPSWATNSLFKDAIHNDQETSFFQKNPAFRKQRTGSKPTHLPSKPATSVTSSSRRYPGAQRHELAVPPVSEEESKEQTHSCQKAPGKKAGSKHPQSPPETKAPKQTTGSKTTHLPLKPSTSSWDSGTSCGTSRHGVAVPQASRQEYKEQSPFFQEAPGGEAEFMLSCTPETTRPKWLQPPTQEATPRGFSRSWLSDLWSRIKGAAAFCKRAVLSFTWARELGEPLPDVGSIHSAEPGEGSSRSNDQSSNRSDGITSASLESLSSVTGPSSGPVRQRSCAPELDISPIHSYLVFSTLTHSSPPSNHPFPGRTHNFKLSQWRFNFFQWPYPQHQHYQKKGHY